VAIDIILILMAISSTLYYAIEYQEMIYRQGSASTQLDILFATLIIIVSFEITRRASGAALSIVASVFLLYAVFGKYIPGYLGHSGFSYERVMAYLYSDVGIFGSALSAASSYVFLFILFGSFLEKLGGGQVFIDLATGVAGHKRGGPAKVAVIASALFGTISGSSVANVAGTGTFTIPMMKKLGYKPHFAGAVEAAASTGGQIMPPVMGSTAFILAEIVGLTYSTLALKAVVPAVLYFPGHFHNGGPGGRQNTPGGRPQRPASQRPEDHEGKMGLLSSYCRRILHTPCIENKHIAGRGARHCRHLHRADILLQEHEAQHQEGPRFGARRFDGRAQHHRRLHFGRRDHRGSGHDRPNTESSKPIFEKVFREYGLPYQLHTDNGPPFGNAASLRRMTMLSVWIMELGITPVYSDPACPQQNGRHERMHRDLKAEATRPPGKNMLAQQRKFNHFREEYNTIRPHEALGMKTPAEVHTWSNREFPRRIRDWDYEKDIMPKMVTVNGAIRWKNKGFAMISTALGGKYVGLSAVDDGLWLVYYRHVALGYFCERTMKVYELNDFDF